MRRCCGAGALALSLRAMLGLAQAQPPSLYQFRIALGLHDTVPREWQGRISVSGGQLAGLEPVSGKHKAGAFRLPADSGAPPALLVRIQGAPQTVVVVESPAGSFRFPAAAVPFGQPLAALDGNARVERVPAEERISESGWTDDHPVVTVDKDGKRWAAWLTHQTGGDAVAVHDGGPVRRVTDKGDHHGPAIAVDGRGWMRVAWAQREGAEFQIYESVYVAERWSRATRLSTPGTSNIAPAMAGDGQGRIALVWQSLRGGQSAVMLRVFDGRSWSAEQQVSSGGNAWLPAAAWGGGKLWIAWDAYITGNYQIYVRSFDKTIPGIVRRVTSGSGFAVRPSVAANADGIPIVAWEESDARLGREVPFYTDRDSAMFTQNRRVRTAWLDGADWRELPSPVDALPPAFRRFVQQPQLSLDPAGRLYLACRVRTASGALPRWESYLTQLAGDGWQSAVPLPLSAGRSAMRAVVFAARDAVHLAWPAATESGDLDVYAATLPPWGPPAELRSGKPLQ